MNSMRGVTRHNWKDHYSHLVRTTDSFGGLTRLLTYEVAIVDSGPELLKEYHQTYKTYSIGGTTRPT